MEAVIQALEHPGLIRAVEHPGLSPHIGDNVGSPALDVPNNPKLPHLSTIARERLGWARRWDSLVCVEAFILGEEAERIPQPRVAERERQPV